MSIIVVMDQRATCHEAEDCAVVPRPMPPPTKLRGFEFYRAVCSEAKYVVAPMVDASELPWRMLSRRYNAQLAYTPMFHALNFAQSKTYRDRNFTTCPEDRPLFVQFCANDPDVLMRAAKFVEDRCDAVDLNLGCPQNIAKRGHYGSFLQDEWGLIASLVRTLDQNLRVPVTCKIRVFPDVEKTVAYAKMIEAAGCSILTVHGRLREQKGANTGLADWLKIKAVKEALSIPVFANGNILDFSDVERCLKETGADGVMSAEGNLFNPALFANKHPPAYDITREYLRLCEQYPTNMGHIRGHVFKLLQHSLTQHPHLREIFNRAPSIEAMLAALDILEYVITRHRSATESHATALHALHGLSSLPYWQCQAYVRALPTPEIQEIWHRKDTRAPPSSVPVVAAVKETTASEMEVETSGKRRLESDTSVCEPGRESSGPLPRQRRDPMAHLSSEDQADETYVRMCTEFLARYQLPEKRKKKRAKVGDISDAADDDDDNATKDGDINVAG